MSYYCGECGSENPESNNVCRECGSPVAKGADSPHHAATVLNELTNLHRQGHLSADLFAQLRARYQQLLSDARPRRRVEGTTIASTRLRPSIMAQPTTTPVAESEISVPGAAVPSWLVEQAPNLLLYLGAFLSVMAALVFVSASGSDIGGGARLAMLIAFTLGFLAVGAFCYRFERVRVAGYTFIAVSALLVPLNFAAAYNFVLEEEGVPGDTVWLSASAYSLLFYIVLAVLGLGLLYGFLSHVALVSAVAAAIAVSGLPIEWAPPVFAALAIAVMPVAWWAPERLTGTFRLPTLLTTHVLVGGSLAATLLLESISSSELMEEATDDMALPATFAAATVFFAALAVRDELQRGPVYGWLGYGALSAALLTLLLAVSFPSEWITAVFIGFAACVWGIARVLPASLRDSLSVPGEGASQIVALASAGAVVIVAEGVTDADRVAVPVTFALAAAFFLPLTFLAGVRGEQAMYESLVLLAGGAAIVGIVYARDEAAEYYSVALAATAALYAAGALTPVERPRFNADVLWPFALAATTGAWLPFQEAHNREPWSGAGVDASSALVYAAAVPAPRGVDWVRHLWTLVDPAVEPEDQDVAKFVRPALILAFSSAIGAGYYRLLQALDADLSAEALALWYLPLALMFTAAAGASRRWHRESSFTLYAVACAYSLFVLGASWENYAQTAGIAAAFAVAALFAAVWERRAEALHVATAYGVPALIFALADLQPADGVWPLSFSLAGISLYGAGLATQRWVPRPWAWHLRMTGLALALMSTGVGFGLLSYRLDKATDLGLTIPVSEPALYLWSTAAVAVLGLVAVAEALRTRSLTIGYAASLVLLVALLLAIGRLRPENPQAYVAPIGIYLLGYARFAGGHAKRLPEEMRTLIAPAELGAAGVLLGTTLIQALGDEGLTYEFVLLAETIVYVLAGLLLRRRLIVLPGLAFAGISGVLFALSGEGGGSLPPWAILAIAGAALLALGSVLLGRRDIWEWAQRQVRGLWRSWEA